MEVGDKADAPFVSPGSIGAESSGNFFSPSSEMGERAAVKAGQACTGQKASTAETS
ncbi:hypothetical protein STRDD11_00898 [Streptococcus sp. DD11]|nr:hypothetical protein STRDD11_00898 [Streptococcus sp. DD11]